jgi:hypothetical protein
MSAARVALPWIIDPIGTGISKATGVPTPGGLIDKKVNPPVSHRPPPAPAPAVQATPPKISMPTLGMPGQQAPPTGPRVPPGDKAGAAPGTDATKGLLKKPGSRSLLST